MTTIFLIHQYVHFWEASTAQHDARRPSTLRFSTAEEVLILKKQGNHNNVRICNGKEAQILAEVDGVLVVQCARNNGGNVRPPADGFNYTIIVEIPRSSSDLNDGIRTLVEIQSVRGQGLGRDPNATALIVGESVIVNAGGLTINEAVTVYN